MIKRKYRLINLKDNEFSFFDEINTILYAGKSEHLEKILNEREEKLCNKIADLEAKLAESKEAIKYLQGIKRYDIGELITKNGQLKQQLAEKEKEHELLIDQFEEETEKLRKQIKQESDARKRFVEANKQLKQSQNQTAIAELEKVKTELEFTSNNNEWITARDDRILNGICDYIDQQIKSLKGEK